MEINLAADHAFGERYDLLVPLWLNLWGAGAVVVLWGWAFRRRKQLAAVLEAPPKHG